MTFGTQSKNKVAESVDAAVGDIRRTAEAASGAFTVVAVVALAALLLSVVAIVRSR
jgi:hypothetical protein